MAENDYRRVRVLWPDHLNLARGKYLPTHLADRGTRHSLTVFALGYDRDMGPVPGTGFLEGMPDMECYFDMSDVRPSWEEDICLLYTSPSPRDGLLARMPSSA